MATGDEFIKKWLAKEDHDPDNLSRYTVDNDRWDRKYVNQMFDTVDDFLINHEKLSERVETGSPAWSDLFWELWKYEPERLPSQDVRPDHLINWLVGDEMEGLKEFRKLKFMAEGDDVASAMACVDLRETLEQLFDKTKQLQDKMQEVMEQLRALNQLEEEQHDIDEMVEQWAAGYNPDDAEEIQEKQADGQRKIQELKDALMGEEQSLQSEVDAARSQIAQGLREGLDKANDNAEASSAASQLWSKDGDDVHRLSAQERFDLARRVQNDRFRHLLDLIGPVRRIMEEAQKRKVNRSQEEMYRVTMGDDLMRTLPSELVKLAHPVAKYDFFRKFTERSLPQYDMRGKERVGKGEIICCLDNSGSMAGQKEMWGKAVAICALHLARQQKRGFYGIHFGSAHQIMTFDFGVDAEFSPSMVMDYAEYFFNGGTDFMRPLSLALDRLSAENAATGKIKGDIMFITDGQDKVDKTWLKNFKAEQKRLDFKVYGFLIGGIPGYGELEEICDGSLWTVADLLDPSATSSMFGAI